MKQFQEKPLDPREIDAVWEVCQGNAAAMNWIFHIRNLHLQARDVPYIEILKWLKSNGYVGDIFVDWIQNKFDNSPMELVKFVRMKLMTDVKTRPVLARKTP